MSFSGMVEFIVVIHKFLFMIKGARNPQKACVCLFLEKIILEMNYSASSVFGEQSNGAFKSESQ